jgi:hypothetical protein
LERAWARAAQVIVFDTVGLDFRGYAAVFAAVQDHLAACSAIHLSHPTMSNGQVERVCPPGAATIEVKPIPSTTLAARTMREAS